MDSSIESRRFKSVNRRELLKLTPVLALGAFAIPKVQGPLLKAGLGLSDWASARLFRSGHLATTFDDSALTPFNRFPINDYDVDDPGVDLERWNLTVTGAVQKPGAYTQVQIQSLPKITQNTRHVCVEGWDVIGNFSGARLSDFLKMIGADTAAGFVTQANHPMSNRRRQISVQAQDLLDERYVSSAWQRRASQEHSAFVKQRGSPFKIAAAERGGLLSSDVEDLLVTIHLASARGVGVVVDTQRAE